ncbi:NADAR family protein [Blastopirellula retiformator]|uniref:Swarming motility protein YbiA n=1 Tax=Blastopirellula retiformator TaxID=2527970 RepID=A0A5C5VIV6_9BACT|nr:NADAR family protein [Blastopirellula retiformator]TWT38526.1 Swarming motility protein YbiA [Blastopirellula retiformator]
MLDLNSLRQRCAAGETFDYLMFWGHQPSKDGSIYKSCFSQWYEVPFTIDGQLYPTAEHWMMAAKARLFDDAEMALKIIYSDTPRQAKALGRKVRNFDDKVWTAEARRLVTEGNLAKFSQNQPLKEFLLATGDQVLVEASPYDRIWGIGLKGTDPKAAHPQTWEGQNLLGFVLMDVREALQG